MRLAFAMLADSADTSPDGKVSIGGGGIDVVRASAFPSVHPMLVLVVQLVSEPSDQDKGDQVLLLEGITPQGTPWFSGETPPFSWHEKDSAGRPAKHTFIARLPMLVLATEGNYTIRLLLGSKELISLPLWADLVPTPDSKDPSGSGGTD